MSKLSRTLALLLGNNATLHPRENLYGTGNINTLNGEYSIEADAGATVMLLVTGVYVGTLTLEGTIDGVNFDTIPLKPVNAGGVYILTLASAATGRWMGPCGGFSRVRVRMSAWTSGTASVTIVADNALSEMLAIPKALDQAATTLGSAGSATTLTIPAPGAGLFQYIDYIMIRRYATAALVASGTPANWSSTNLPGTLAGSVATDALPQGSLDKDEIVTPGRPVKALAANTACTIVLPALTSVQWRATAFWTNLPQG